MSLSGVNWSGTETGDFAPEGFGTRNCGDKLDQIAASGFNTIRLPYSTEMLRAESVPQGINFQLNPDLKGLSPLEILDKVIQGGGTRGLRIILDRHRPDKDTQTALWYSDGFKEDVWIKDWIMLAERYQGDPTLVGADLHNEPHNPAT